MSDNQGICNTSDENPCKTREKNPTYYHALSDQLSKADLDAAWSELNDRQRYRVVRLARELAGFTAKPHVCTLEAVAPGQGAWVQCGTLAKIVGVTTNTIRRWSAANLIPAGEVIGGSLHFPPTAIAAAKKARKRRRSPGRPR